MAILKVPHHFQEKDYSCNYASARMALEFLGHEFSEDQLRGFHYVDHDKNGTSFWDLAKLIENINKKQGDTLHATFYLDPTTEPHAVVYSGGLQDDCIVSLEDPRDFVKNRPRARDVLDVLKEKSKVFQSEALDSSYKDGCMGPVFETSKAPYVSRFEGSPKKALERYNQEVRELEEIDKMGFDVRFYVPGVSREKKKGFGTVQKGETVEGFVYSGIPVIVNAQSHSMVAVGYDGKAPMVHDPELGPYLSSGTKLHSSMGLAGAVVIQRV